MVHLEAKERWLGSGEALLVSVLILVSSLAISKPIIEKFPDPEQAVQFEYLLLSTFFTDFDLPTAVSHMEKWPTPWKAKRLSTLFAVH